MTTDRPTIDALMLSIPTEWRNRWCYSSPCACMGCANYSGGLAQYGYTKKDYDAYMMTQNEMTNTPIVPEETIKEWEKLGYISKPKVEWIDEPEPENMITEEWANKSYPNFYELCKELVDDLDSWMEFDEKPSMLWQEYEKSMNLIKKVRKVLRETQND